MLCMDADKAIEIVRNLADGVDPFTGERFPSSSPYQNADTVRALHLALDGLDRLKRSKAKQHDGPPKAGKPWTKEEEQRVLDQFNAKVDLPAVASPQAMQAGVSQIAQELERTEGAIWARLEKLGRISKDERMNMSGTGSSSTPTPSEPTPSADREVIPDDCPF